MNHSSATTEIQLKPLFVYCCPETGQFYPVEQSLLPDFFAEPEIAVSCSAGSKGWSRILARDYKIWTIENLEKLILKLNTYDLLIVYPLSLNSLAKFALGIQDSLPTILLNAAAQAGKPILLNDQFVPVIDSQMNPHLIRTYRQHWENLQSGTICGFNFANLETVATRVIRNKAASSKKHIKPGSSREFITRDDIIEASESLSPLKIAPGAIITDLAREEAQKLGVVIIQ
jgi:hypothetical protein